MGLDLFGATGVVRARWIALSIVAAALLMASSASAAPPESDISVENAFISTPGKAFSLQGVLVTNNGPAAAAGVTVTGQVPGTDDEGHAVDWEIFTNKATSNGGIAGFYAYMSLSGPPYGTDPCTFTSGTDYKCDIGPLAVGEGRTIVFNPTWESPSTTTDLAHPWHPFSISADVVGGTDPDNTNNDNVPSFNTGFYYTKSMMPLAEPNQLRIEEQSPPPAGVYDPGATVTLKITSTVSASTAASVSVVVPDTESVTCSGDGVCLTGGPRALTGPPNRVMVSMVGTPIAPPAGWWSPATPPPFTFTTLLSAELPTAPAGCSPGSTVPITFDTTQQPLWGGSGPVWGAILKEPFTVQVSCPDAPPSAQPDNPPSSPPATPPANPPATPAAAQQAVAPHKQPHRARRQRAPKVRLKLSKVASRSRVQAGQRFSYLIKVENASKDAAKNVRVCDQMPSGLALVGSHPKVTVRKGQLCWLIKRLGAGNAREFKVAVKALRGSSGRKVNHAAATAPHAKPATAASAVRITPAPPRPTPVTG